MKRKNSATKTDPELVRQIRAAKKGDEPVQAVFTLGLSDSKTSTTDEVHEITRNILDKAELVVGKKVERVKVFGNLGAFVVSAAPSIIEELLEEPEIESAVANQQPDSMKIS